MTAASAPRRFHKPANCAVTSPVISKGFRALSALASPDPLRRIWALERITERLLWKLPKETAERYLELPAPLPQSALEGARLFADRELMLAVIPKGGEVAEVGTWRGEFSKAICRVVRPARFHLIDIDFSSFDWSGLECEYLRHQGDSSTVLREFPTASLDWIYIDGDHSYEGALKDLEAAHRALKPGALITCNDYTNWASLAVTPYGVARAVNEFVIREGYRVLGFALSPSGNHDLLIQRPG